MRKYLIIVLLACISSAHAQIKITWETLSDVTFADKWSKKEEAYYYHPTFGASVKALDGQEIIIKGYFLPINPREGLYILSYNSFANCFFCGNAGPESIIALNDFENKHDLRMDEIVVVKGKLRLNADDIYECNYVLDDAEILW